MSRCERVAGIYYQTIRRIRLLGCKQYDHNPTFHKSRPSREAGTDPFLTDGVLI